MKKGHHILAFLAFLSGCCGLAYEVLYNRILSNVFGDAFSVSFAILATFLLGIAVGYLLARFLKRWLFAIEIGIGLYSMGTMWLILKTESFASDMFLGLFPILPGTSLLYSTIFLLPPAILIGTSIPILSRYMSASRRDKPFDITYILYNFGAGATVLLIEFLILQYWPVSRAVALFGTVNIVVGICLFGLRRIYREETVHRIDFSVLPAGKMTALFIFSAASASYQLLLLKMATFVFGPFRENFSLTVFTAILAIALGTCLQSRRPVSFRTIIHAAAVTIFLEMALFKASVLFLAYAMGATADSVALALAIKVVWVVAWGVPLLFFGMSVPVILHEISYRHVENASGLVLFLASAGNVSGYILMFFLIHPLFPYGTMFVFLGVLALLASFAGRIMDLKRWSVCLLLVPLALLAWDEKLFYLSHTHFRNVPGFAGAYGSMEEVEPFSARNQTLAVVRLKSGAEYFFIDGYTSIVLRNHVEKVVGTVPRVLQPKASSALVLGLGSGNTAGASSRAFADLDVVEINPAVVENQPRFAEFNNDVHVREHVRILTEDGVIFMKQTGKSYDVVVNTVTSPLYFSSSKLYTRDFLKIVEKRLNRNGVYYTWFDGRCGDTGSRILIKTILSVFRHVGLVSLRDSYFLVFASNEPLPVRVRKDRALLANLREIAESPYSLDFCVLTRDIRTDSTERFVAGAPIHTLDYPTLEYAMARLPPVPKFEETKQWIRSVMSAEEDPLTGERHSREEQRMKYLYQSVYLPSLAPDTAEGVSMDAELVERADYLRAFRAIENRMSKKAPFARYLKTRRDEDREGILRLLSETEVEYPELPSADAWIRSGDFSEGLKVLKPFLLRHYDDACAHALAGFCLVKTGEVERGMGHLRAALRLNPGLDRFRLFLASVCLLERKDDEAARQYLSFFKDRTLALPLARKVVALNYALDSPLELDGPEFKRLASMADDPPVPGLPDYDFISFDVVFAMTR